MANPILSSDLYKDDGSITTAISQLEDLEKRYLSLLKNTKQDAVKLEVVVKKLSTATSHHREEIVRTAKDADKLEREYEKYTAALNDNAVKLAALRNAKTKINQVNKLEAKLAAAAEGSYDKLSAQYSLMKIRLNQMSKAQRESTKEGKELEKQSNEIFQEMKRLQAATGKTSLNVGNYKDSVKSAIRESKGFNSVLNVISRNPIVLTVGLLVGAITGLFQAFKRTEAGAQLLAKATGFLNGIFSQVLALASNIGESLMSAFSNPKEALNSFVQALKDQVFNRFIAFNKLIILVGKSLKDLWNRDFQALKENAVEASNAVVQLMTGLDAEQQRDFADAIKETIEEVKKETNAFIDLEVQKRRVAKANRSIVKSLESLITQEELYRSISDDSTKSFKEREEAAEKARQATEARAKKEIQLAKNNLALINSELSLRQGNKEAVDQLLDQQLSAYRELASAERSYTLAVRDNEKTRSELKQDRLERDLDILIDAFDNQKSINERLLNDDDLTLSKRAEIYGQTAQLAEESFQKQIETIQQFTGIAVDENDLIKESNAVVLNEKIRSLGLSEIIEGRLLEIIRERRVAVQDLNEAEKEILKERRESASKLDPISLPINNTILKEALNEAGLIIKDKKRQIQDEIREDQEKDGSLFSLLGFNFNDQQKQAFKSALDFAKEQVLSFLSERTKITDQLVANSDREVDAAQRALDAEIQNRNAGYANRVDQAKKDLALAQDNQKKALREQEKAQRAERQIQTAQQAANLITAVSQLWVKPGWPLALPLTAVMFGSFAAAKIRASQLSKKQFGKGGLEFLVGGSHASGNDIPIGTTTDGRQRTAEGGEAMAIFNKKNTAKYRSSLPEIVRAINSGTFEQKFQRISAAGQGIPLVNIAQNNVNTSVMERELATIRQQGERQVYWDGQGRRVEIYKNVKRIYV